MTDKSIGVDSTSIPIIDETSKARFEIHEASREGLLDRVEALLEKEPASANRVDNDGRLPIHWATSYNHIDIVKLFTEQPKFYVNVQDKLGWSPLMIACCRKDGYEMAEMLVNLGADINQTDTLNQTALHLAVSKGNPRLVEYLLKNRASVTQADRIGRLPIHRASAAGNTSILKLLLQQTGQVNRTDTDGMTPLHNAIAEGHIDAAFMLIEEGADTGKISHDGRLPIEMAESNDILKAISTRCKMDGIEIVLPKS